MAQHGEGLPNLQISSPARIQPQPMVPGPREFISLGQPRPNNNRKQNEYIDTPLRPQPHKSRSKEERQDVDRGLPVVHRSFGSARNTNNGRFNTQPVIVQPTVTTFKKEKYPEPVNETSESEDYYSDSIICRQCGKCKCGSCRTATQLPSRWICDDKCLCSVQNVVDHCTCLCCVKGIFYHWAKDYDTDENVPCSDNPCSCGPQYRCARWGCMGAMSILLPCLCFYWPLSGCVKLCEMSYAKMTNRGCRCTQHRTTEPTERAPEKRLLDSNFDC